MKDNFSDLIRAAADKHQIPFDLLKAQVRQESGFNPLAVSKCGARGLLQLMPATGRECGLASDADFFEPEKNLAAGALYLSRMHRAMVNWLKALPAQHAELVKCGDDDAWKLALACYNGGMGYVLRALNLCVSDGVDISWTNTAVRLADNRCCVRGKHPDHKQITEYVSRIFTYKSA